MTGQKLRDTVKAGMTLTFKNGVDEAKCEVLEVTPFGMHVQFEDRFASTCIRWCDDAWTRYLMISK